MGEDGTNTKTAQVTVYAPKMYRKLFIVMWHMEYSIFLSYRSLSDVLLSQQGNKGHISLSLGMLNSCAALVLAVYFVHLLELH